MAITLRPEIPVAMGVASWTVAGIGMGLAYAPISLLMLRQAPPGREGWASASLNLADVLGARSASASAAPRSRLTGSWPTASRPCSPSPPR